MNFHSALCALKFTEFPVSGIFCWWKLSLEGEATGRHPGTWVWKGRQSRWPLPQAPEAPGHLAIMTQKRSHLSHTEKDISPELRQTPLQLPTTHMHAHEVGLRSVLHLKLAHSTIKPEV